MINADRLILASASPRRRALLEQAGYRFQVRVATVEEQRHPGEDPTAFVRRLALAKVSSVRKGLGSGFDWAVLGADTAVVIDGEVLGKPRDRADGLSMLARLSGRAHEVLTAVALAHGGRQDVRLACSRVVFRELSAQERQSYWETGEPCDKAGSYAIQGMAAIFIERLEGSYSGVVGLPLFEAAGLLRAAGVEPMQLRHASR